MRVELCPGCGTVGRKIDTITPKALLTSAALRCGIPGEPRFCANVTCDIVYFGDEVFFTTADLVIEVFAKTSRASVPVCYCFGYTPAMIGREVAQTGSSSARQMIIAEVQARHCACEVRNPKGSCCLGDVAIVERRAQELIAEASSGGVR